jgi:poly(hydroxyalkanoate) depolymerase family esterase
MRRSAFGLGLGLGLALACAAGSARAGTVTVESHVGRSVRVFVPTKPATPTAMVVMLHGCTQTADLFADATQMDVVAEENGFVVAYIEQPAATISTRCFRWYEPAHQARDAGEPKELADATTELQTAHGVDPERVYVAGISAGAAMSVVLGATYPDRFTAIGVVAGVEYKGASSLAEAFGITSGGGPDPATQGALAFTQMGPRARAVPAFVVHGTADGVVAKVNGDQVAEQWRQTNTLALGAGAIDPAISATGSAGYTFTRLVQRSKANGASVIDQYVVEGLGHAWPGGKGGASYSDPKGPDASRLVWAFFSGRTRTAPLDVPPVVLPPAGSPDGGTSGNVPGATPADPSAPTPSSGSSSGDSSGSGGGCEIARSAPPARGAAGLFALAVVALAAAITRRRQPSR